MGSDTLTRAVLAAALAALGLLVFWAWNRVQLRRLSQARGSVLRGLEAARPGVPAVLYFTTPDCLVCKTAQKPALQRLQTDLQAGVQIVEIDATVDTAAANYWGVLSVPTTFVIDAQGKPRAINHGLTSKEKLQRQLEATLAGSALNAVAEPEVGPVVAKRLD
ncbi:MAG: thioredoxin family protein [Anaerolineales bacterium]|nr:thioredoxin family protein [Anaerolineales bacterium]